LTEKITDVTWMSAGGASPNRVTVAFEHEARTGDTAARSQVAKWDLIIPCAKGRGRFTAEVSRMYREVMLVDLPTRTGM
jgi:hypothetical protein